jgi:2Fe-2S ferredoxin
MKSSPAGSPATEAAQLAVRGESRTFTLAQGQSILEAAMAQGLALDHACGGVCACSTCHVKVHRGAECLSAASEDELDQLDEARDVGLESRLGCQARLLRRPADGVVEIAVPTWNVNAVREGH